MSKRGEEQPAAAGDPSGDGHIHGVPDATLGGYFEEHSRPPAFEGVDGEPYTVSIEIEKTADLGAPFKGYLTFPRWASSGVGVVGHVETETLLAGTKREQVEQALSDLPLVQVKVLLDRAIQHSARADVHDGGPATAADEEGDAPPSAD